MKNVSNRLQYCIHHEMLAETTKYFTVCIVTLAAPHKNICSLPSPPQKKNFFCLKNCDWIRVSLDHNSCANIYDLQFSLSLLNTSTSKLFVCL